MTPLPEEVVMGNLHDVAETATVATAGVATASVVCAAAAAAAAAVAAAAAAVAAAVKMPLQYAVMNASCCMLKVNSLPDSRRTVIYVQRGESVQ